MSFEIARRHRFHREMAALPDARHRARAADRAAAAAADDSLLAYRDFAAVMRRIDAAYDASSAYLAEHL